jgi:hypothetical protein
VLQFHPDTPGLAATQGERGMADPYDERIAAGPCLGDDLHLLAVNESELEEPPLERTQSAARPNAHHPRASSRGKRREAHESRVEYMTRRGDGSVHKRKYG